VRLHTLALCAAAIMGPAAYAPGQSIVINEVMSSNVFTLSTAEGKYEDWIELYNTGDSTVDLSGFGISDNYSQPFKWVFPATTLQPHAYMAVFASEEDRKDTDPMHTNFKISANGEAIFLHNSAGVLVDMCNVPALYRDISYGRYPDGDTSHYFFDRPTPIAANSTAPGSGISLSPVFSMESGFYADQILVTLARQGTTGTVYYSLDGSEPNAQATPYTTPVSISHTTVIRARTIEANMAPSPVISKTYFINDSSSLPVISLVTDPVNFFDDSMGIYTFGTDYSPFYPWVGANFHEDWERPVHLEFFETDKQQVLNMEAGVKIYGGNTRESPEKTLAIYARGDYDYDQIAYRIFPNLPYISYTRVLFRNSGNDWEQTMFRDAMITSLAEDLDMDIQAYRPSLLFLNGKYWGIHNIREKYDRYYFEAHHGVNPDSVDLMSRHPGGMQVTEGDSVDWTLFQDFVKTQDLNDSATYEELRSKMDIQNCINYYVTEIYIDNTDWPGPNYRRWKAKTPGGKWRWLLFDTDCAWGQRQWGSMTAATYTRNSLDAATDPNGPSYPNKPISTELLRNLLACDSFKVRFINTFADRMNTTFDPAHVCQRIDSIKALIDQEIPRHIEKWAGTYDPFGSAYLGGIPDWENYTQVLYYFANNRRPVVRDHVLQKFNLSGTYVLTIRNPDPEKGSVMVNTVPVADSLWSGGYFNGNPLPLVAIAKPGYAFKDWGGLDVSANSFYLTSSADTTIRVNFIIDSIGVENNGPRDTRTTILEQNRPNPFNASTMIGLYVATASHVTLRVFSIDGKMVLQVLDQNLPKGRHSLTLQNSRLSSGIYYCHMHAETYTGIRRMMLIK